MFKAMVFSEAEWSNFPENLHKTLMGNISKTYTVKNIEQLTIFEQLFEATVAEYLQSITQKQAFVGHTLIDLHEWSKLPVDLSERMAHLTKHDFNFIHRDSGEEAVTSHLDIFLYEIFRSVTQVTAANCQ